MGRNKAAKIGLKIGTPAWILFSFIQLCSIKYFNSWARPRGSLREWINGREVEVGGITPHRWFDGLPAGFCTTCLTSFWLVEREGLVGNNESLLGAVVKVICVAMGKPGNAISDPPQQWSQHFQHQGPVLWKMIFPVVGRGWGVRGGVGVGWGWVRWELGEGFGIIQGHCIYCISVIITSPSQIRSWRLGSLALQNHNKYCTPPLPKPFSMYFFIFQLKLLQGDPSFC